MRLHHCKHRGCRELIGMGKEFCETHYQLHLSEWQETRAKNQAIFNQSKRGQALHKKQQKQYNATTRQELHGGFYDSKRWRVLSKNFKVTHGYTDSVFGKIYGDHELIVDHIVPRRLLEGEAMYDPENLWLLDWSTHNRKTAIEKRIDDEHLRHMTKEEWTEILKRKPKDKG